MPIDLYFTDKLKRQRLTVTQSRIGTSSESWNTPLEFYGKIIPAAGSKGLSADRLTVIFSHMLFCPVLDITAKDRIVDAAGNVYRVVKPPVNPNYEDDHLEVELLLSEHDQDYEPEEEEEDSGDNGDNGEGE